MSTRSLAVFVQARVFQTRHMSPSETPQTTDISLTHYPSCNSLPDGAEALQGVILVLAFATLWTRPEMLHPFSSPASKPPDVLVSH